MANFYFIFTLIVLSSLTSCGPGAGKVRITLLTNLDQAKSNFHNLSKELFRGVTVSPGASTCSQNQVYAGYKLAGADNSTMTVQAVQMTTQYNYVAAPTPAMPYSESVLSDFSEITAPIVFDVPEGKTIDIGILGAFYLPPNGPSPTMGVDGCTLQGNSFNFPSRALNGHAQITAKTSGVVPVGVWSVYSATLSPTPCPPSTELAGTCGAALPYTCTNSADPTACAYRNLRVLILFLEPMSLT